MFINLFNLIKKAGDRTPLEDFTTESFAGILKNAKIRKSFVQWLKLPPGNYDVLTQQKHCLEDDMNCVVDLVLESNEVLCFIENKVDCKEGWKQLERYSKVLDLEKYKQTFLFYCTKRVDIKKHKVHQFKQFRWYEIARWLKINHNSEPLVQEYLNFLNKQQMAQDTSISTDTVIALNKFMLTYEAMKFHLNNASPAFKMVFPQANIKNSDKLTDIKNGYRIAQYSGDILQDKSAPNEILYCIHFESVKLQTQIWIEITHPQAESILKKAEETKIFKTWKDEAGIGIFLDCKLYQFIESKNSDQEIQDWFRESFQTFRNFIDSTPELGWDIKVLKSS